MQAIQLAHMKRTSLAEYPCSIARTLDVAGEWWSPLILRDVAYGVRRFGEIQEDLGISANVLSDRLEGLVAEGLLKTHVYQSRPERHEYRLTEKGADLVPALLALMRWGDRWQWPGGRGPVEVVHEECGHEIAVQVRCEHCDRELQPAELRARLSGAGTGSIEPGDPGYLTGKRLALSDGGIGLEG
jgi:DNA-binding HxlR family transcriptional regulator